MAIDNYHLLINGLTSVSILDHWMTDIKIQ
jgi:hypothetical protein